MTTAPPRRRGRPPLEDGGRDQTGRSPEVTVSLGATDYAEVQRIATASDASVGSVIRRAVRTYLYTRRAVETLPASPSTSRLRRSVAVKRRGL